MNELFNTCQLQVWILRTRDALAKKTLKMTNFLNSHDPWDPEIIQKNTHTGL